MPAIYAAIPQSYDDLGQLELGEEHITVQQHVFAQIGVVTPSGVLKMIHDFAIGADDVFCDLGSGVGNICMQIIADSPCKRVSGVEIIPSRNRYAERAFAEGRRLFPELFGAAHAAFLLGDVATCDGFLNKEKVTVLFTHSHMFDDDLMLKVADVVRKTPSLRVVITSRALPGFDDVSDASVQLRPRGTVTFEADWNDKSPFFVYERC